MAVNPDLDGHISHFPHLGEETQALVKAMVEEQTVSSHARTASVTSAQAHIDAPNAGLEPSFHLKDTGCRSMLMTLSKIAIGPEPALLTEFANASPKASTNLNTEVAEQQADDAHRHANIYRSANIPPAPYLEKEAEAMVQEVTKEHAANERARVASQIATQARLDAGNRCERPIHGRNEGITNANPFTSRSWSDSVPAAESPVRFALPPSAPLSALASEASSLHKMKIPEALRRKLLPEVGARARGRDAPDPGRQATCASRPSFSRRPTDASSDRWSPSDDDLPRPPTEPSITTAALMDAAGFRPHLETRSSHRNAAEIEWDRLQRSLPSNVPSLGDIGAWSFHGDSVEEYLSRHPATYSFQPLGDPEASAGSARNAHMEDAMASDDSDGSIPVRYTREAREGKASRQHSCSDRTMTRDKRGQSPTSTQSARPDTASMKSDVGRLDAQSQPHDVKGTGNEEPNLNNNTASPVRNAEVLASIANAYQLSSFAAQKAADISVRDSLDFGGAMDRAEFLRSLPREMREDAAHLYEADPEIRAIIPEDYMRKVRAMFLHRQQSHLGRTIPRDRFAQSHASRQAATRRADLMRRAEQHGNGHDNAADYNGKEKEPSRNRTAAPQSIPEIEAQMRMMSGMKDNGDVLSERIPAARRAGSSEGKLTVFQTWSKREEARILAIAAENAPGAELPVRQETSPQTSQVQEQVANTSFDAIHIHTATCDVCNRRNTSIYFRCKNCVEQMCIECMVKDSIHRLGVLVASMDAEGHMTPYQHAYDHTGRDGSDFHSFLDEDEAATSHKGARLPWLISQAFGTSTTQKNSAGPSEAPAESAGDRSRKTDEETAAESRAKIAQIEQELSERIATDDAANETVADENKGNGKGEGLAQPRPNIGKIGQDLEDRIAHDKTRDMTLEDWLTKHGYIGGEEPEDDDQDKLWIRLQFDDLSSASLPVGLPWQSAGQMCGLLNIHLPNNLSEFRSTIENEALTAVMDTCSESAYISDWLREHCVERLTVLWNYRRSGGSSSNFGDKGGRTVVTDRNLEGVVRLLKKDGEKHVLMVHYAKRDAYEGCS